MFNIYLEAFLLGVIIHAGLLLNAVFQNSFILINGVSGKPVFGITVVFFASSILSAILGIYGVQHLVNDNYSIKLTINLFGTIILLYHAFKSFKLAQIPHQPKKAKADGIIIALAMVWLTPHVYTDMVIISSLTMAYEESMYSAIVLGFSTMAGIWFLLLSVFAKKASKWFYNTKIHKFFHYLSAIILVIITIILISNLLGFEVHHHH